jgi:hypothetical protein
MASDYEVLLLAQVNFLLNNTPVLLQTTTLGSPQASVTLNVPSGATYNFLQVKWRTMNSAAVVSAGFFLRINGDSGNNYIWENGAATNATIAGVTSGAATSSIQVATIPGASATALYFGSGAIEIGGASDLVNFKTLVSTAAGFTSTTGMITGVYSGQWNNAAAVTSITLLPGSANLVTGSIFSLYGLN